MVGGAGLRVKGTCLHTRERLFGPPCTNGHGRLAAGGSKVSFHPRASHVPDDQPKSCGCERCKAHHATLKQWHIRAEQRSRPLAIACDCRAGELQSLGVRETKADRSSPTKPFLHPCAFAAHSPNYAIRFKQPPTTLVIPAKAGTQTFNRLMRQKSGSPLSWGRRLNGGDCATQKTGDPNAETPRPPAQRRCTSRPRLHGPWR
jgi:hypothetical protein